MGNGGLEEEDVAPPPPAPAGDVPAPPVMEGRAAVGHMPAQHEEAEDAPPPPPSPLAGLGMGETEVITPQTVPSQPQQQAGLSSNVFVSNAFSCVSI